MIAKKVTKKRNGVFIGAYVPEELKLKLRRRAKARHTTLSKLVIQLLKEAVEQQGGTDDK